MASSRRRVSQSNPAAVDDDDEMMAQPKVFDMVQRLNHLRRATDTPMTVDEQADVLSKMVDRQEAQKRAHREAIMTAGGDVEFDPAAMEEAVRALKRQKCTDSDSDLILKSKADLNNEAQKMYAYGPEEDFEPVVVDPAIASLAMDTELLSLSDGCFQGEFSDVTLDITDEPHLDDNDNSGPAYVPGFNLLDSVCSSIWLATEVGKHLRPRDIVNLYSVSRSFHDTVRQHWQSTIVAWGQHMAPSSMRIFFWKFYAKHTIQDPTGTTWAAPGPFMDRFPRPAWAGPSRARPCDTTVRLVPGLRYLAMIVERETRVRDILACLARSGHRVPRDTHETLKKVWLLMDIGTNSLRRDFIRNAELWRDGDLYNAQLFFVKLQMRLNEPCFGPDCPALAETLLGSRDGLTPLWGLLRGKAYTDLVEVMQMRARYQCGPSGGAGGGGGAGADPAARHRDEWQEYFGVPAWDLGFDHLEGWGEGHVHLSRPDELVVEESARRGLSLQDHLVFMVLWGHVDWRRRRNMVPSEEEMYMSDDELPPLPKGPGGGVGGSVLLGGRCGNVPFEPGNWLPIHALKARWDTLTDEEKRAVNEADASTALKMMPWDDDDEGFFDPDEGGHHDGGVHEDDCVCEECGGMCETCGVLHDEEDDEVCCGSSGSGDSGGSDIMMDEDMGGDIVDAPMCVTDRAVLAAWDTLTPMQKELIVDAHQRRRARQRAAEAAAGTPACDPIKTLYPRDYKISDPTCLALLRKYDVFPHEVFSTAAKDKEDGEEKKQGGDDEEKSGDGDGSPPPGDGDDDDDDDDSDADNDSYGDDEALKALADEEYSSDDDEMTFDVNKYKSYLAEAREAGTFPHYDSEEEDKEDNGSGEAHEADMEGTVAKIPMKMRDTHYC
ncbi:hypothetical protein VMCG_02831 [Cytospora schulzeri]|uniref:Uncharacterized protein n=1 Tax=Cytospora schulzeri TaxID=448051 RepID=A0A423WZP1_9PEZI|nr:hypothetical protein VMCG_02831 [Valsa malicola]